MAPDGLNSMVMALHGSQYRDVLKTAMEYLVTGFDTRVAESSLVSSFTALETIANGIAKTDKTDEILDRSVFTTLKKHLKSEISGHVKKEGMPETAIPLIFAKLGELNRPAITPRVCAFDRTLQRRMEGPMARDVTGSRRPNNVQGPQ